MRTEKYKAKNLNILDETSRDKYVSKETGNYDCTSHSKIDFERTKYNVNVCPHEEYGQAFVKFLNEKWRGGGNKKYRKLEPDDNIFFMTVLTLPKNFLPELQGLEGAELTEYIMSHPDVKKQVEDFFNQGYEGLKKIYHLDDMDVISAYVHYDETTPHMHFTAIPHVHIKDELKEADPETVRLYELSANDPIRYCEEQRLSYLQKADKTKEQIDKAYLKGDVKRAEKLQKSYEKWLSNIEKLDKADPYKYAAKHRSKYKSKISAQKGERETVSYEKVVPLSIYNTQHNLLQDMLSKHFDRHIGILNGNTKNKDFQKLTAEQKAELLATEKEISILKAAADDEALRLGRLSTQAAEAQKELIQMQEDISTLKGEKSQLALEKEQIEHELKTLRNNAEKEAKGIISTAKEDAKSILSDARIMGANLITEAKQKAKKIKDKSDFMKGYETAKADTQKALDAGLFVDGEEHKKILKQLSDLTQKYNSVLIRNGELESMLENVNELERED